MDLWLRAAEVRDDREAEEHAARMREFEEAWKDVPEQQQRAFYEEVMNRPLSPEEIAELGFDPAEVGAPPVHQGAAVSMADQMARPRA